jgi:hypothetical protein
MHVRVLPLFAAILLAGVPGHAPPDWPFAVGETLHFNAKIGYFPAGSAELQVVRSTDVRGKPAVVLALSAKGGPPGLASSWALTSLVESASFSSRYRRTGGGQDYVAPAHPMDELALLYYLRTLPLKPGDSRALRGYFQNGFNPVTVTVLGRERVEVGSGVTYPCLRLRIAAAGKSSDLWLTDDARRIPARASVSLPLGTATLVWDGR